MFFSSDTSVLDTDTCRYIITQSKLTNKNKHHTITVCVSLWKLLAKDVIHFNPPFRFNSGKGGGSIFYNLIWGEARNTL